MVKHQIISEQKLLSLKMALIDRECIDQFVVGLLLWYQDYKPVRFTESEEVNNVPNLFELFEYSSYDELITHQFVLSDIAKTMREIEGADYETVERDAIDVFNGRYPDFFDVMVMDCRTVLDAYNLFYCYQDDAQYKPKIYNPYLKEVW